MAVAIRTITRLQDADDINVSLGAGVDEYALCWDNDTAKFVLRATTGYDHGLLAAGSLADDDHTQYALLAGRAGGQTLYGGTAANQSITIHGTSDATRTTSYVLLQPTAGRVGIGTIAPVGVLEAVTQIGTDYPLWLTAYASDPVPGIVGRSARGTQATPSATQLNDFLFAFGGRGYTGSAFETNSQVLIAMKAAEIHSSTNQGTYITFGTTPIGSVSRAEVARITDTGRVGIGTTSPATALHVVGAATITAGIRPAADSTTALQLQNAAGTSVLNVDTTNARVGIGTTSPDYNLDVDTGTIRASRYRIGGTGTDGNAYAYWNTAAPSLPSGRTAALELGYAGTSYATSFPSRLNAHQTAYLQATSDDSGVATFSFINGLVGIGTTSPATRLDIDAGAMTMAEMTAPTGVANKAMLYTKDNGSGKTQLCCKLGDDVEIVIATQA